MSSRTRRGFPTLQVALSFLLVIGVALVLVGLRLAPGSPLAGRGNPASAGTAGSGATPTPTPTPTPTLPPLAVHNAPVNLTVDGWYAWAMMDQRTGEIYGSKNMGSTSGTASMIKAWIASDFLRRSAEQGVTPSKARLNEVSIMIRDSDNNAAQDLWEYVGGAPSITRMVKTCKLTDSKAQKNSWSQTQVSPRDTTRLAACIADGRAAGKKWTSWLLNEMRQVRGVGDFGIRKAFPADEQKTIAIKNGWVTRSATGEWNVNCLAIGDGWTMGVMSRYEASKGYTYGADICKKVAKQLLNPDAAAGSPPA
ncbi:serine hydrolase [Rhizomonospora bruguierae]|uniref:serine hydrolase n=1 Tax=Rhizomonospora bruguierae TaxID=1581705 RepID=UPI001BCCE791|nr:serine hydrolase [Micromonospora sp. NBRC 107566]